LAFLLELHRLALAPGSIVLQPHPIRIGTRGSPLALAQAHMVRDALMAAHAHIREQGIEIVVISTKGDRVLDRALAEIGGKGLFTEEIESGLLDGSIHMAVHSLKDMPTTLPPGLELVTMLEREDPRDAFLSPKAARLVDLPQGAVVGTASLRRQAQVRLMRPDLQTVTFRGNVQTRLKKLEEGQVDATLLALAGLKRLNMAHVAQEILPTEQMLPAVAQGIVTVEARADDAAVRSLLAPLDHEPSHVCALAERALLARLDGSCRTPIAALATVEDGRVHLRARLLSPDGRQCFEISRDGPAADAARLGDDAGQELRRRAGDDFFARLKGH
jgi:hydroxymethylbilane synthase